MKAKIFSTYSTTPLGLSFGKWDHGNQSFGQAGKRGWFASFTLSLLGKRYQAQIRHDVF